VAADDRGECAGEAAGVNGACRREAETRTTGFPYSNAVREVDSSRARQADSSSSSIGSLSKVSPSRRHRFRQSRAEHWHGGDRFDSHNPKEADVHEHPDGWTRKGTDDFVCAARCGEGRRLEGSTILSALPTKNMVLPSRGILLAYMRLHVTMSTTYVILQHKPRLCFALTSPCVTTCTITTVMANCGRKTNV
jgi:hypothetical protein